jgi:hypothetical protein
MPFRTISFSLSLCLAICCAANAVEPVSKLYPFGDGNLAQIRKITAAEGIPSSPDLKEAWRLYLELKGSWMPDAPKPAPAEIAKLDALKRKLEGIKKPDWYSRMQKNHPTGQAQIADAVGDPIFKKQRDTPEFQALKALAIVYMTEIELDRSGAAQRAGESLSILSVTHAWDWDLSALLARLFVDSRQPEDAWHSAIMSIYLNPAPTLEDFKFFGFVGGVAAKKDWPEIQVAIRQAAPDKSAADEAIKDCARFYTATVEIRTVPPKTP